ncbi:MAG: hypothetical protein IJ128_00315 [Firmicutes bacterium]|nr:hypothetical protein [Bacillota bacterium]
MERIKEGIIEVDGIVLSADTTIEDLEKIDIDKAVQRNHPHGYLEVIFNHPVENDGVQFQVSMQVKTKEEGKVILLDPKLKKPAKGAIDVSREKQEICEEWLKRNMGIEPSRDTDDGIFYDFPWGHIYSSAASHINFGHLQGCIHMYFGDKVE